ncbi:hypothetical protein Q8A64_18430 [Oxalobacteraceae bacterium R-40]|uniref:Uncharacterized protein n=1 Tax=Keguizhuia sedimenti TaxID=3064264 RepID=A0ABU1BVR5_9BURK|nr:hypothetical protein [Oxalobacteraceae bacterium R-40]
MERRAGVWIHYSKRRKQSGIGHIKDFMGRQSRPVGDESVKHELKTDAKGRAQAENVAFVIVI